jgi:quinol monooxygenase YgiN
LAAIKLYSMKAKSGHEKLLASALRELAARIRSIAGCERVEILQGLESPGDFFFVEHWTSLELQKAGGRQLGKDAFKAVLDALAAPPAAQTLQSI